MNYNKSVITLNNVIESLELPKRKILNHLNHKEPVIYLCGKSTTGKTTFLNALFNFDKNELYTSTDVSTKTIFKFRYGLKNTLCSNSGIEEELPTSIIERKELFKKINIKESKHVITLKSEVLNGRVIIDIPGVFDHTCNDEYSDNMLDEADIVYFFTSWMSKVNSQEYDLLKKISEAGIPIVVLFTMGDITNADEGITRKEIPDFVEKRLATCFEDIKISHYQIISSNDFYKRKVSHGLDSLQMHIKSNEIEYKEQAKINRLKRVLQVYTSLIQSQVTEYKDDQKRIVSLSKRENELWFSTEQQKIKNQEKKDVQQISNELQWLLKSCQESINGKGYRKVFSANNSQSQETQFIAFWKEFWENLKTSNETLNITTPSLPSVNDNVFNPVKINEEKWNEIVKRFSSSAQKDTPPLSNAKASEVDNKKKVVETVTSTKPSENKRVANSNKETSPPNKKRISIDDIIELGVNLKNAKILYDKWSFINGLEQIISDQENFILNQINRTVDKIESDLLIEKVTNLEKVLTSDITTNKLKEYTKYLNALNQLLDEV